MPELLQCCLILIEQRCYLEMQIRLVLILNGCLHKFPTLTTQFLQKSQVMAVCLKKYPPMKPTTHYAIIHNIYPIESRHSISSTMRIEILQKFPLYNCAKNTTKSNSLVYCRIQHTPRNATANPAPIQQVSKLLQAQFMGRKLKLRLVLLTFPPTVLALAYFRGFSVDFHSTQYTRSTTLATTCETHKHHEYII